MAEEMSREEREKRLSKAYNTASQTLREMHRDDFNRLYSEAAQDLGVHWEPRLTAEQRAERELLTIFEAFPELRERYAAEDDEDEDDSDDDPGAA